MKITSMFHILTFLTATLIFSTPLLVLAQEVPLSQMPISEESQAIKDAERDAVIHLNRQMWFAIGCLLAAGVGLLVPYFIQKTPLASALLGKSPEYVAHYTDTYQRESQKLQFQNAVAGCLLGTGVSVAALIFLGLATEASLSSGSYSYY